MAGVFIPSQEEWHGYFGLFHHGVVAMRSVARVRDVIVHIL